MLNQHKSERVQIDRARSQLTPPTQLGVADRQSRDRAVGFPRTARIFFVGDAQVRLSSSPPCLPPPLGVALSGGTRFGGFALFARPFLRRMKAGMLSFLLPGSVTSGDLLGNARGYGDLQRTSGRPGECHIEMHPDKPKIVYCKDAKRKGKYPNTRFDFLGYCFGPKARGLPPGLPALGVKLGGS
jgi:hypothetical protein